MARKSVWHHRWACRIALGALITACSDGGTGPAEQPRIGRIAIDSVPATLLVRDSLLLRVRAFYTDGSVAALSDSPFRWSTPDPQLASVSAAGLLRVLAPGTVRAIASLGTFSDTVSFDVSPRPAAALTLSGPAADSLVLAGDTLQLTAVVHDDLGELMTLPAAAFTWTVLTDDVARLEPRGLLALGPGIARVAAQVQTVADTIAILVEAPAPSRLTLSIDSSAVLPGDTLAVSVRVEDQRGRKLGVLPAELEWASLTPATVSVSQGVLAAGGIGPGSISAAYAQLLDTLVLTVDTPAIALNASELVVTRIPERLLISGSRLGVPLQGVPVRRVGEDRWNADYPVVDSTWTTDGGISETGGYAAGWIAARFPGTAVFETVLPRTRSARVQVRVEPSTPVVFAHDITPGQRYGTGDTISLTGYHLADLPPGSVTVDHGDAPVVLTADSLHLRIELRTVTESGCPGAAGTRILIPAASGFSAALVRERSGERVLAPGEVVTLSPGEAGCLRLRPDPAGQPARYVLAFQDTSAMNAARTDPGTYLLETRWTATASDRSLTTFASASDATGATEASRRVSGARPPDESDEVAVAAWPVPASLVEDFFQSGPWSVGDTLLGYLHGVQTTFVVEQIHDGYFAMMTPLADTARYRAVEARLDSVMLWIRGEFASEMDAIFEADGRPRFMGRIEQLGIIVSLDPATPGCGGFAYFGWMSLGCREDASALRLLQVLAHELTHVWHTHHKEVGGGVRQRWNTEGLGSLWELEATRRWLGIPFNAELAGDEREPLFGLALEPYGPYFSLGYSTSAAVAYDLAWLLTSEAGLAFEAAVREVTRAFANGWYGCNTTGSCAAEGVAEALPRLLGRDWLPGDALTDAMLAAVADAAPRQPRYQRPLFDRASYLGPDFVGWYPGPGRPLFVIETGSAAVRGIDLRTGDGATIELVDRIGGTFSISAQTAPAYWKLMRIQ